jgi:hypothetical protein
MTWMGEDKMSRPQRIPTVRKAEIERTLRGVIATGLPIVKVEVEGGKLVIYTRPDPEASTSPLEAWRRENGQG